MATTRNALLFNKKILTIAYTTVVLGCHATAPIELQTAARSTTHLGVIGGLNVSVNGLPAPLSRTVKSRPGDCLAVSGNLIAAPGLHFVEDHLLTYEKGIARYTHPKPGAAVESEEVDTKKGSYLIIRTVFYSIGKEGKPGAMFDEYVFRELLDEGTRATFRISNQTVPPIKGNYELRLEIYTPLSQRNQNGIVDFGSAIVNKLCDVVVE